MQQRTWGLTGNQLKILALVAMTCDHVGLQLLPQVGLLRIIGRLALPIYAYMIAEGCRYTSNRMRYLGRLAALAAVCQIVYFFALGSLYQCILVTFSLSVILIWLTDRALQRRDGLSVVLAATALAAVWFVCTGLPRILTRTDFAVDYGFIGVMIPVMVYYAGSKKEKVLALAAGALLLALETGGAQWFGLAAVPLLALYNGQRGKWKIGGLFYLYYPLHLVAIYGISLLCRLL